MAQDPRILNLTRNFRLKRKQAERAIENCACAWVEYGVSVRDLTLAEAIAARNKQATEREPLASAEIPGLLFEPPTRAQASRHQEFALAAAANRFFAEMRA